MEDLQSSLQSILSNPEQMARVAALAESLGLKPPDQGAGIQDPGAGREKGNGEGRTGNGEQAAESRGHSERSEESACSSFPPFGASETDLAGLMARLSSLNGSEDRVLNALRPSLSPASRERVDRASRAAKLSRLAGQLLRARGKGHV